MIMGFIRGFTRTLGVSQGYLALRIKDDTCEGPNGSTTPVMKSLWYFTPEDLATIKRGGAIELQILGTTHPPVLVKVVPPEDFDPMMGQEGSEMLRTEGRDGQERN